jgi:predicted membrane protein
MSKNNPYTVPDGFFEEARADIMRGAAKIRRRRIAVVGVAAATLAALLILPLRSGSWKIQEDAQYYAQLADDYEYDYFLQIFD